jgi:hypothetical protein
VAFFFMFCSLRSALMIEVLTLEFEPEDEDVLLLLDELADDFALDLLAIDGMVVCLKPAARLGLPVRPGESDLLLNVMGLLDFGLGIDADFLSNLLQSEHKKTERGSFTSASLIDGRWHS